MFSNGEECDWLRSTIGDLSKAPGILNRGARPLCQPYLFLDSNVGRKR